MKALSRGLLVRGVAAIAMSLGLLSCGDIGNLEVDVDFPDADMELRTRALLVVIRQVPESAADCATQLWSEDVDVVAEDRRVIEYPNRNDILARNVGLSQYPSLTLVVYAYPSLDVTASRPIGGGCRAVRTDPSSTSYVRIALEAPPTN